MIYKLVDGIATAINDGFGDTYTIYIDKVSQGLNRPSFFINTITMSSKKQLDNVYLVSHSIGITFFPEDINCPNEEIYAATDGLHSCLEVVPFDGGYVRGSNLNATNNDGELNYTVEYNFRIKVPKNLTLMQVLAQDFTTKGR